MTISENHPAISISEAFRIIDGVLSGRRLPSEVVPTHDALGRTVVVDLVSRLNLPPFNKSAMDGYAVLADDERDSYRVLETVPAGSVPSRRLEPGTAIKVMTGAPVPEGTGKVIVVEDTTSTGDTIRVLKHRSSVNVCLRGEDVQEGDVIVHAPAVLGAVEIGNLASCGITEVKVAARPKVCILSTGSEIVDSPEELLPGRIMNSNGPMLAALCHTYSMEVTGKSIVPDARDATASAIRNAIETSDIVLLTGGVSVGDFDYVCEALADADVRLHFNGVNIKPGKPLTFATGERAVILGLPGNPVSVYLMFHLFVLHVARLLAGGMPGGRMIKLPLAENYERRRTDRTQYEPCKISRNGEVIPVECHGSADLRALLHSDGFFVIPQGMREMRSGSIVTLLPTRPCWADSFDHEQRAMHNTPASGDMT